MPIVVICPLHWGLGHATRCIPVASRLLQLNCKVIIAGSKQIIALYKNVFGNKIDYIIFEGIRIKYGKKIFLYLLLQVPLFIFHSIKEHFKLKKILHETSAQIVISDNRYGLWSKKAFTIFITHQLNIKLPAFFSIFQNSLRFMIKKITRKHDVLWIPDYSKSKHFAGELTQAGKKYHSKLFYTGLLTRFSNINIKHLQKQKTSSNNGHILCIISGPEPQRTIFEKKLLSQLQYIPYKSILLRGIPGDNNIDRNDKCTIYNHTDNKHFAYLIANAKLIICRPGYSTLMDLSVFGCKALLVPTPGQPEQEYLASLFKERKWSFFVKQKDLNVKSNINTAMEYRGIPNINNQNTKLNDAIDHCFSNLNISNHSHEH